MSEKTDNLGHNPLKGHTHRWHDIIERNDKGEESVVGLHCFECKETVQFPKLADIGTPVEVELVNARDFLQPAHRPQEGEGER